MIDKLVIGTAQFGLEYGINNKFGIFSKNQVCEVLNYAVKNGIKFLDTSTHYGNSEEKIGFYNSNNLYSSFDIISKIASESKQDTDSGIKLSLKKLNRSSLYAYLIHDFSLFFKNLEIFNSLIEHKQNGLLQKIGFSLYHPEELDYLLNSDLQFDIVQVPYNIFDQRFEPYFNLLKDRNIEIHIRSVFLQGLLLMSRDAILKRFPDLNQVMTDISSICKSNEISIYMFTLLFAFGNQQIDKIVIGFDTTSQLVECVNILKIINYNIFEEIYWKNFVINDKNIILPYKWRL